MNELQIFNNEKYGAIRTSIINNEPYFMLADVCRVLEIGNPTMTKQRLNKNGVNSIEVIDNLGRQQQATFINESNLYKLAFTSRKKEAEEFTEWVTSEVLPSIRKHGIYMTSPVAQQAINNPTEFLARAVLVANQELDKLKMENAVMKPKADYFDGLVERNTLTNFRETAKLLHIGQNKFINWLLNKKFIYRDIKGKLLAYSNYISGSKPYFDVKEQKNGNWSGFQTLITPQGREAFRLLLQVKGE